MVLAPEVVSEVISMYIFIDVNTFLSSLALPCKYKHLPGSTHHLLVYRFSLEQTWVKGEQC
jgi:hypothetical protein